MFDKPFSHYLSYGSTDQRTARELRGRFDGLLVPGTVAAFQQEGTGGFVLSLSATSAEVPYVIDPRFPLFQQALRKPKRSHTMLAGLLASPSLVSSKRPKPEDFDAKRIRDVAEAWACFNTGYTSAASGKFAKYAERLGEPVDDSKMQSPRIVLAPYLIANGTGDPWWRISESLYDATSECVGSAAECVRVVATERVEALQQLLLSIEPARLAIWVSGLDELAASAEDLAGYLSALQAGSSHGHTLFALYGGFFGVLASGAGLRGASHGIGYGESRKWIELPESGPPPPRYYLRQVHRYVSQELALRLSRANRALTVCECQQCEGKSPVELDYHSLMKHSVLSRTSEIAEWSGKPLATMLERLASERSGFLAALQESALPDLVKADALRQSGHLQVWCQALEQALPNSQG